jgi:hypothetical protein
MFLIDHYPTWRQFMSFLHSKGSAQRAFFIFFNGPVPYDDHSPGDANVQ